MKAYCRGDAGGYGAVAPSSALRTVEVTAARERQSNGKSFMVLLAGVLVLALVVGHKSHASSAKTTNLASAHAIEPVEHEAMTPVSAKVMVAQKALAQMPSPEEAKAPQALNLHTQRLQDDSAPKSEDGGNGIDLLPPKDGIKGGRAKELTDSVHSAFEDEPDQDNSHYFPDHTDKEVHLLIIFFLLLGTVLIFYFWRPKEQAPVAMTETKSKVTGAGAQAKEAAV